MFPTKGLFLFGSFLLLSLLSVISSVNKLISVTDFTIYITLFIIFVYSNHLKNELRKKIVFVIFIFSLVFSLYSIFLTRVVDTGLYYLLPSHGYQLVYSRFNSHNHLGDFLILPITVCFYYLLTKNKTKAYLPILGLTLFLPYLLFSYSRSAYFSLVIILIVMIIQLIKQKAFRFSIYRLGALLLTACITVLFLFSVGKTTPIEHFNTLLKERHLLTNKTVLGNRDTYFQQAINSIKQRPLLGVGPGNFIFASKEFGNSEVVETNTAHSIFIEVMAENGIPAGIIFVLIIISILRHAKKDLFFYLALALLLNFQTDYTYRIYPLLVLFVILLGINYIPGQNEKVYK